MRSVSVSWLSKPSTSPRSATRTEKVTNRHDIPLNKRNELGDGEVSGNSTGVHGPSLSPVLHAVHGKVVYAQGTVTWGRRAQAC